MQAIDQLRALYHDGGFVMPWLFAAAAALWAAIGYRWATLRRGDDRQVRALLETWGAQSHPPRGLLDTAVDRAFTLLSEGGLRSHPGHGSAQTVARAHLSVAWADIFDAMTSGRALIRAIVIAAPLTGLLGTVSGMIEVFSSLGDMALFSQSGGIAGGVAQALTTTQMGLAVAIPGTVVSRLLDAREARLRDELGELEALLTAHMEVAP